MIAPAPDTASDKQFTPPTTKRPHSKRRKIGLGLLSLVFIGSLAGNVYALSQLRSKEDKATELQSRLSMSQDFNKKLISEVDKAKADKIKADEKAAAVATANKPAVPKVITPEPVDYTDGNFVVISPNSGFMETIATTVTYEWTPHKQATKYLLQIKFIGQQDYPATTPADQTVTYATTAEQPSRIKLTKRTYDGDYQWRITAVGVINGKETVLQSTNESYFQMDNYTNIDNTAP